MRRTPLFYRLLNNADEKAGANSAGVSVRTWRFLSPEDRIGALTKNAEATAAAKAARDAEAKAAEVRAAEARKKLEAAEAKEETKKQARRDEEIANGDRRGKRPKTSNKRYE